MTRSKGNNRFIANCIRYSLFYFPYLIFLLLLLLCFFCSPSAEDLAINYYSRLQGLGKFISRFYHDSGSRYFSFPIITWLCNGNFVLSHYYLVLIFLFIALWLLLLLFVKTVTGVLTEDIPGKWIMWFSLIFLLSVCSAVFEIASFFYWMTGSITYLPSLLLFLLLLTILIRTSIIAKWKIANFIFCVVLVVFIAGTNEIGLYFLVLFLFWAQCL